jgi:protein TonB
MFEQSTLTSGPSSKRLWATCLGVTGEALLVGFAILAPMLWPQMLPRTTLITSLLPPVPPGRPKAAQDRPRTTQAVVRHTPVVWDGLIHEPGSIPKRVVISVDLPPEIEPGPYVPGAVPRRVKVSAGVRMAEVIHRVEPQYPSIARSARVQGVVELVGVIATDGHLKELKLVSGHPLLAHAAMEAVSQWIYRPTTLNGEPVEVIAPITVTFRLN